MAKPDGRIEKGQRLSSAISARAWNRAQDAADRVLGVGTGFGADAPGGTSAPYTWVYCKNTSGATVPRWGVLKISGVEVTPTSDATASATTQFEALPVLTGTTPDTNTTAWCVAIEPIENDKIGRVAVDGVVQVKLDIQHADHVFARCKASASELQTAGAGEALVLWKEASTGVGKWALARIGTFRGVVRGTFTAPWSKGNTTTVTDATSNGVTYTAKNYFASLTGSGSKACAIAYVAGEWILIAAEC